MTYCNPGYNYGEEVIYLTYLFYGLLIYLIDSALLSMLTHVHWAYSSSLFCAIIACNHLPFFKKFSNFVHFCKFLYIFKYFALFQHFFALFLKKCAQGLINCMHHDECAHIVHAKRFLHAQNYVHMKQSNHL